MEQTKTKRGLSPDFKIAALLLLNLVLINYSQAQVQIKPLPRPGYEQRIKDAVNQIKVADTHEHLMDFGLLKENTSLDFMLLLSHYSSCDIISAGMPWNVMNKLLGNSISTKEKWDLLKPYWEGTSNTAYNRAALLAADKLYGVKNIDSSTVELLSEKIRNAYLNPEDWVRKVLKEKCGIQYVVEDWCWDWNKRYTGNPDMFRYVRRFDDDFVCINSKEDIARLLKWKSTGINTLDDLVSALGSAFQSALNDGIIGIKSPLAYRRDIFYENVKKEDAEKAFNKIKDSSDGLSFNEVKPLQDYMMHRLLDLALKNNLPVQIHTGLQSFNGNIIENSRPTHLVNLFQEYPDVKFILFHGSYPYGGELATLAKNFRNVYIDMCWLYIISPSYSERYLNEWLETVPANKIMAFGGDEVTVEAIYSHLLIARQVISNVLISKIKDGYFTEEEAINTARMILHDNAVRILNLNVSKKSVR